MRFLVLLVVGCTSGGVVYLPGAGWTVTNADGRYAPVDSAYEAVGVSANAVMAYRDVEMIPSSNDATRTTEITIDAVQPGDDYRGQPQLPTDCMTQVMMFSSIGGSATWQVELPTPIDARLITNSSFPSSGPDPSSSWSASIDDLQDISTAQFGELTVELVSCPNENYDDLRPALLATLSNSY